MKIKIVFIFLLLQVIISCGSKFDAEKWKIKSNEITYTYRSEMIDDLIENVQLKGLNPDQIINLLGEPDSVDDEIYLVFYYTIEEEYGFDIDPIYLKYLVISFDKDGKVKGVEVTEISH